MNTFKKLSMVVLVSLISLTACSKDNVVEFYSTGEWRLDRHFTSGNDDTDNYLATHQDYVLNLKVGNDFTETALVNGAPYGVSGTWEVTNDAKTLRLYDPYNGTRSFDIVYTSAATLKIKNGIEQWDLKRP